ncbi:MAG: type II toxin-antitoxin system death-on-curing family toxin [Candidatus Sulfotelmatobacter sp.]
MEWIWIVDSVVLAIHEAQLAEHGGMVGIRDGGLLASVLARPRNVEAYGEHADAASLAAAYGFGLSRNHPFLDGNKRTAFVVMELFLNLNGWTLDADDAVCISMMLTLAAGKLSEEMLAKWLRGHLAKG